MLSERALVLIGSNIEPERYLPAAVTLLEEMDNVEGVSRVYQSTAVGAADAPDFLNVAVQFSTNDSPVTVRHGLRTIEQALGRTRQRDRYAPRTIDLDLCFHGHVILRTDELTIPHPDTLEQAYMAVPLAELVPDFRHPVTGEAMKDVARRLGGRTHLVERQDVVIHQDAGLHGDTMMDRSGRVHVNGHGPAWRR